MLKNCLFFKMNMKILNVKIFMTLEHDFQFAQCNGSDNIFATFCGL
jgi:hypothetical protein